MKKIFSFLILSFLLILPLFNANAENFPAKLKGMIVLQAEDRGQLWYINPVISEKYYFNDAASLFKIVKAVSLGISNKNFDTLNKKGLTKLAGRILIKAQDSGRAYYITPGKIELVYLGRPDEIFKILAGMSIGVSNKIIQQIKTRENFGEITRAIIEEKKQEKPVENNSQSTGSGTSSTQTATSSNDQQNTASTTPETPTTGVSTSTAECQFLAEYFSNKGLFGDPATTTYQNKIDFDWGNGGPAELTIMNKFSIRWTSQCYFTAGTYKFTAIFDDAMRVYIDDEIFIQSWSDNDRTRTFAYEKNLADGEHNIRVEYYDAYGRASAKLAWEKLN